ncbi:MAG: hypothetical protein ABIH04_09265 [Planctomycetota bacterium]
MMIKQLTIITIIAVFSLLWISSEAFSTQGYTGEEPDWMKPFADSQPVYKYDWAFGTGSATQGADGQWISTSLSREVGKSRADGVCYANPGIGYWTTGGGQVSGFSLTNDIGAWLEAIGTGNAVIRYTIREDYSGTGSVDNSDIIELFDDENERLIMPGYTPGGANLGLGEGDDITGLEWNPDFDDENLVYDHMNSINDETYYRGDMCTSVQDNQDNENVYMTWGATGQVDGEGNLTGTTRANEGWTGTTNGYTAGDVTYSITANPDGYDESLVNPTFDGTNWFLPVTVSSTQYDLRMDKAYDAGTYADPNSCGAVIQWYDDYDLYLAGASITNPGAYGVSGRYMLERDEFLSTGTGLSYAHHADVCYEMRTYVPTRNPDGPESPYEWLYDASGDMYVPTNGSGSGGDTEEERAFKLISVHPFWVDDDTTAEIEFVMKPDGDGFIWKNSEDAMGGMTSWGALSRGCFVDSWRLAGLMLGQEFWNDDPDYLWSGALGTVAERTYADDIVDIGTFARVPVWTWDSVAGEWVLPDTYDYWNNAVMGWLHIWEWVEDYTETPVAGYDTLNTFMRFVFDIDALVVEDVDGDGEFDVGDDYVLFSVVDDGLYSKYNVWGTDPGDDDAFFDGQYFDGDTIFLYDGTSVTTFFDAASGIFFGNAIDTATGYGVGSTLWSMFDIYDLDALDIGILPEPSTIFLMIGSASGLAVVAGIMRKKLR